MSVKQTEKVMANIHTFSGGVVDLFNFNKDDFHIIDAATALSNLCRYAGQVKEFYSVAEHTLGVADMLPTELEFEGLCHDLEESLIIDLPKPVKYQMAGYRELGNSLFLVIAEKLNLPFPHTPQVKEADTQIVKREMAWLFGQNSVAWKAKGILSREGFAPLHCYSPFEVRKLWLRRFSQLLTERSPWWKIKNSSYEINPNGLVRHLGIGSDGRKVAQKILVPWKSGTVDYLQVTLSEGSAKRVPFLHKLVMETFIGPCPEGMEINHIDGNKENNVLSNLEYVTPSYNDEHALSLGLKQPTDVKGNKNPNAKVTAEQVISIRTQRRDGISIKTLAKQYGLAQITVSKIVNYDLWKHLQ